MYYKKLQYLRQLNTDLTAAMSSERITVICVPFFWPSESSRTQFLIRWRTAPTYPSVTYAVAIAERITIPVSYICIAVTKKWLTAL